MNYARDVLRALRFAGIDEYVALRQDEREALTELLGDWNRIVSKQNARLEREAEEQEELEQFAREEIAAKRRLDARDEMAEIAASRYDDDSRGEYMMLHGTE